MDTIEHERSGIQQSAQSGRPSDHRRRDLWQFNLDAAFGRAGGQILWQPRILAWFTDRQFRGEQLPGRFQGMTEPEVYRALGCSNRVYEYNACFCPVDHCSVRRAEIPIDSSRTKQVVETPVGTMSTVLQKTPASWYHIIEKQWIETPEDMKVATWLAEHSEWRWDQDTYDKVLEDWGRIGAPTMYMPRVNVQHLYLDMMGVEHAIYALYEWGDVVSDYFRILHENHLRLIELINQSPLELINFGDNIHCETLSPQLYEEHVIPAYHDRCKKLHTAGKFVYSHWDGKVKALLKYARVSGLDGIEAITPIPQGDVTLEETKEALGDEIMLVDGIPAVFFDETFPIEELAACVEKIIKLFGSKLILGISDEMSSQGDIERVAVVGRIVDDYNASLGGAK